MWNKEIAKRTFCPLAWNHLATNTRIQLRLCCNSSAVINLIKDENNNPIHLYQLKDKSILNNNPTLNKIRKEMLSGQKPIPCKRCFKEEAIGVFSARKHYMNLYPILDEAIKNTNNDGSTKHKIQYIDLRLGNLCNLRCRMCNPYTSKKLIKESLELNLISRSTANFLYKFDRNKKNLWSFLNKYIEEIDTIYLTGGEPTLIDDQFNLLKKCIKTKFAKNITLKYNTNITHIPSKFFNYWKEFKRVNLNCSVDGVGSVNEYIRNPSDWKAIDKNLQKIEKYLTQYSNWRSQVHTTVQIYNIIHLIDLFEYLKQYKKIINFPTLNILNVPKHFCIKVLPTDLKIMVSNELMKWFKKNFNFYVDTLAADSSRVYKLPKLVKFMNSEDWNQYGPKFKFYTTFYDKNRNENFSEINPKLREWYESINMDSAVNKTSVYDLF